MSQLERLKEQQKKNGKHGKQKQDFSGGLFTFRPNSLQRDQLLVYTMDYTHHWEVIGQRLLEGCTLNIGASAKNDSFRVVLRELAEDWRDAQAVSVWHSDVGKCIQGMAFYLEMVNEDWPKVATPQLFEDEW